MSPYHYCAWNPIKLTDLNGDSICYQLDGVKYYYTSTSNGCVWVDKKGITYNGVDNELNKVTTALKTLQERPIGNELVNQLMNDKEKTVQIACTYRNGSDAKNGEWVTWNPNIVRGNFLNEDGTQERPSFIGLGHELAHISEVWYGSNDQTEWFKTPNDIVVPKCEKVVCGVENLLRSEHGISQRQYYFYYVDNKKSCTYRMGLLIEKKENDK